MLKSGRMLNSLQYIWMERPPPVYKESGTLMENQKHMNLILDGDE